MTKILNLDKIVTKNDKVITLNGKDHAMKVFTVKEYIFHMREAQQLVKANMENDVVEQIGSSFDATIKILLKAFPTVKVEEFENLTIEQLNNIMEFIEESNSEELAEKDDNAGESKAVGTA